MSTHTLEEILNPASIAVIGASASPGSPGYRFAVSLKEYGYQGKIYPVNPKYDEIEGMKVYPSILDIPGPVDYVISSVPAAHVLTLIEGCAKKAVKGIHLFTARFSETGRKAETELEQQVLAAARKGGIRIIGPNCMGVYSARNGISFSDAMPKTPGSAGLISQSGQIAEELVRYAALRGVYFNKAISYGNALDLNESDYLEHYTADRYTRIILMYVEGIRDGDRFFKALKKATAVKPVVILKGGRGEPGRRATASHTASMAGDKALWEDLIGQAGAVSAGTLEELIDLAAAFHFLPPVLGKSVGIAGGGGGASVLSADQCDDAGLNVIPLPEDMRQELKDQGSAIWDWIGNPVDMSIRGSDDAGPGAMLEKMAGHDAFHLLIAIMSDPHHEHQKGMSVDAYLERYHIEACRPKPFLAVVPEKSLGTDDFDHWSWKVLCDIRTRLIDAGIPFFSTISRAAIAAGKIADYYQRSSKRD
jgi:acyl-CoA synthetase (NDP forming)